MSKKIKFLKATIVKYYCVEMINDERTEINGWKFDNVIKDWFEDHNLDSYHAARNGHNLLGASYVEDVEIVDHIENKKFKWNKKDNDSNNKK